MTSKDIIAFEYAQTASRIYDLKQQALKTVLIPSYGYYAEGSNVGQRTKPLPDEYSKGNYKHGKTNFVKITEHMSPKSPLWKEYSYTRSRARMLCVAILLAKGLSRKEIDSQRRDLVGKAKRYIKKVENRLSKQPQQYAQVEKWLAEREDARALRAAA